MVPELIFKNEHAPWLSITDSQVKWPLCFAFSYVQLIIQCYRLNFHGLFCVHILFQVTVLLEYFDHHHLITIFCLSDIIIKVEAHAAKLGGVGSLNWGCADTCLLGGL